MLGEHALGPAAADSRVAMFLTRFGACLKGHLKPPIWTTDGKLTPASVGHSPDGYAKVGLLEFIF
jgi:hypothetical protein